MNFESIVRYVESLKNENVSYSSVPDMKGTLYGTCYALQTIYYLSGISIISDQTKNFILSCQDQKTGYFIGPELLNSDFLNKKHDEQHILLHLLCTVIPVLVDFKIKPKYEFSDAKKFLNKEFLKGWLEKRDWSDAWLEGNNLLFVGEILAYFRDIAQDPEAIEALGIWYRWLENEVDPNTGLWGTNGYCSNFAAMCGGYHQLLLYYYDRKFIPHTKKIIDTVLRLQHIDGGFSPKGGGGACEDVDAVDMLVNLYKLTNYKKDQIRCSLKRCLKHIISLQNQDGGFPYKKGIEQSHMGIPDTKAGINESTMFATWFRVHTLALICEILPNEKVFSNREFFFNSFVSMGWHRKWENSSYKESRFQSVLTELNCALKISSMKISKFRKLIRRYLFKFPQ